GPAGWELPRLARQLGADQVFCARRWEPAALRQDGVVAEALAAAGVGLTVVEGGLLNAPDRVRKTGGGPYQVFTPYWRTAAPAIVPGPALPVPPLRGLRRWPATLDLRELRLLPRPDWAGGLRAVWQPGEAGAHRALAAFVAGGLAQYEAGRDLLAEEGISRLSPHLHFGELSPAQVWRAVDGLPGSPAYQRQLGWREFGYQLLCHFPHTPDQPLRPEYGAFPWGDEPEHLRAWQQGRTGYPLVDAGMRQLWQTGWMHNRARMVTASFLVKHLLIRWQEGARWFWDTLVDANLANNTLGWQWAAGCGADAAPYFRIFNPARQGERFDPQGRYVRRWVPELEGLPDAWVHRPSAAPAAVLAGAGVVLGRSYPFPLVDHAMARGRALAALAEMKQRFRAGC
ncbi:MAG: deoxyribodipyrimidine photo-lyase, partial [Candidatus Latescibacteria bacterium]|nr:deoxyribodipyrimidine photo-lyase [Candidatus Latescibacterota bacterium]